MYTVQIRIYQVRGEVKGYGEYSDESPGAQGTPSLGHVSRPLPADSLAASHADILACAEAVCARIAEKLDVPLF